jgi:hypothetical protein
MSRSQRTQQIQDQDHDQNGADNTAAADRALTAVAEAAAGQQKDKKNYQKQ